MNLDLNIQEILSLDWESDDKVVMERIIKHFKSWKRFIPSSLEKDIIYILNLAINEKKTLMELNEKLKETESDTQENSKNSI